MLWYVTSSSAIKMKSPGNCLSAALFSSQVYWSCDFFDKLNDWQLQYRRQYKAHVNSSLTVVWVISCPISLKFSCLVKLASASEKSRKHCYRANTSKRKNNGGNRKITKIDNSSQCRYRQLKRDAKMENVNVSGKRYSLTNHEAFSCRADKLTELNFKPTHQNSSKLM